MDSGEKSEDDVLAVRWVGDEPDAGAMKTRRPTAREPDSFRVSTWPRRTLASNFVALVDDGFGVGGSGLSGRVSEDVGGELLEIGGGFESASGFLASCRRVMEINYAAMVSVGLKPFDSAVHDGTDQIRFVLAKKWALFRRL